MSTSEKHEQTMGALERANYIRRGRAALKRKVGAGELTVAEILDPVAEIHEVLRSMPISELLTAQRRWGDERSRKFLQRVGIAQFRRVDALTARQRRVIVAALLGVDVEELAVAA